MTSAPVFDKVAEELMKSRKTLAAGDHSRRCRGNGRSVFAMVNLARPARGFAEEALLQGKREFERPLFAL